jgi:hypothetical protein
MGAAETGVVGARENVAQLRPLGALGIINGQSERSSGRNALELSQRMQERRLQTWHPPKVNHVDVNVNVDVNGRDGRRG